MHKIFGLMVCLSGCFVLQSQSALADQLPPLLKPTTVLKGPIGPFPDAVILVHEESTTLFSSIVARQGDKTACFTTTIAEWDSYDAPSIDAGQADADADIEVLVVGTFTSGVGPDGAEVFSHAVILDWQTDKFVAIEVETPKQTKSIFNAREAAKFSKFKFTR